MAARQARPSTLCFTRRLRRSSLPPLVSCSGAVLLILSPPCKGDHRLPSLLSYTTAPSDSEPLVTLRPEIGQICPEATSCPMLPPSSHPGLLHPSGAFHYSSPYQLPMPKRPTRLLLSRSILSDDELRVEQARFDRLVSKFLGQYNTDQRRQMADIVCRWARDITVAPSNRSRGL
jgi:hypothetical protein